MSDTTETYSVDSAVAQILAPAEESVEETLEDSVESEESVPETTDEITDEQESTDEAESYEEEATDVEEIESEADQVEPETYTVKVDGEEISVTLDDLKRGYSGQQYVQKGMKEAAELRKQTEATQQALLKEQQQVAALYQQLQKGEMAQAPVPPSKELFQNDPIGYVEAKMEYDEAKSAYDSKMQNARKVMAQQQIKSSEQQKQFVAQEFEMLSKAIPDIADETKSDAIKGGMVKTAERFGYTAEEVSQVVDHRALLMLHELSRLNGIVDGAKKAEKKVKAAKPVLKAGAKKVEDSVAKARQRRKARLKKSGSIDDALGLIVNG